MKVRMLFLFLLTLMLVSCSAPGKIIFERVGGKWEPVKAEFERKYLNPGDIKHLQDLLNNE